MQGEVGGVWRNEPGLQPRFVTVDEDSSVVQAVASMKQRSDTIGDLEMSLAVALVVWGNKNPRLREVLLRCRRNMRETLEAGS
jgi:hypothetical protein